MVGSDCTPTTPRTVRQRSALHLTYPDREGVAAAVRAWQGDDLEERVVVEGGCAAVMRSGDEWASHPHGAAVAAEPAVAMRWCAETEVPHLGPSDQPLAGIRVLDLTRVIAGPVCTRFLAAYGADVLRIDPPRFEEVPALVPETSAGKHTAFLDLAARDGHARFEALLRQADVVVCGLRPGVLRRLDLDAASMRAVNPALIVAELDAYGWTGPWAARRGFDSLVQMSSGIASAGGIAHDTDQPFPLPAQALDHATGFVLAGAICRAITRRQRHLAPSDITAALIGTANLLVGLDDPGRPRATRTRVDRHGHRGPRHRVGCSPCGSTPRNDPRRQSRPSRRTRTLGPPRARLHCTVKAACAESRRPEIRRARRGSRTPTPLAGPAGLSRLRLPFRHPGRVPRG